MARAPPSKRPRQHGEVATVGRRCYVMNLSWDTTWQTLKDHFRQVGTVVYADVMTDVHSGRSKGAGIVEFEHADEALQAISTLSNSELDGRSILVREDREDRDIKSDRSHGGGGGGGGGYERRGGGGAGYDDRRGGGGGGDGESNTVMVQNLPWSATWQTLKDFFRPAGEITRADVAMDSGRSKGWGTVSYNSPAEAARAIQMFNGAEMEGRSIACRIYT
eukprot:CAMPEP_0196570578 /NCGR_PEP_ID=MMETSP1081-20130531/721_1 /TAXON_ID=36882 /ORGANISM="Pyramimonas amylifera, Strain CCMP720" /LENGTH=219 /DNA_ID=CAMNT_0041887103 /DNA_START=38 /DNA_END=697 /DNA_ORIENTATION=+